MTNAVNPDMYIGRNAVDPQGNKIGSVGQVYLNDETGQPDWITVNAGLFGMKENFARSPGPPSTATTWSCRSTRTSSRTPPTSRTPATSTPMSSNPCTATTSGTSATTATGPDGIRPQPRTSAVAAPGGVRGMTRPARTPTTR